MNRRTGILFLVLLLLFTLPVLGEEEESIILTELSGDVQHRGSEFYHRFEPATEGMAVFPQETVRVGMGSKAELVFPDGVEVLLRENTEVRLHLDEVGELELRVLQVDEGEVVVRHPEGLLDRIRFEVETPSAIAAVRGTIFRVRSDEWLRTTASVQHGTVAVSSHNPTTVILTPGMMTTIDYNQNPLPPFPLTQEEQDRWDQDEDWLSDDDNGENGEEEIPLEEKVLAFYNVLADSYAQKDKGALLELLDANWTSDTGDNIESLNEWLETLFGAYDSFTVHIEITSIERDPEEEQLVTVQYNMVINGTMDAYDYQHREEGVVEEILLDHPEEGFTILFSASD